MTDNRTLVLETGLFEDAETLRGALAGISPISFFFLHPEKMNGADWDNLLRQIMSADKVITV